MSYNYLDKNGLTYFWGKIKDKLNLKQDTLVSGTSIKTINNNSILGSGNMELFEGLTFLSYGNSTWNDFITAYNKRAVVYCRASSNSNPASGSQTRLAFMAYVNNAENPTNVEFQYYRSMSSHSATNQGDQVYVYKLESANGGKWTVTTREASTKIVAGTNMSSTYSNGTLTLSATGSGGGGTATDVQINGTSIVSNNSANILTNTAYNASTNKIATMTDIANYVNSLNGNGVSY